MKKIITTICALMGIGSAVLAEVKLPKFFSDNMVLQQQTECNIWGTAEAGKTVAVKTSWDNKTYKVKAADNGKAPYSGIWTNAKYRMKGDALLPAGLMGPVEIKN